LVTTGRCGVRLGGSLDSQAGAQICNGLGIMRACLELQKLERLAQKLERLESPAIDAIAGENGSYRGEAARAVSGTLVRMTPWRFAESIGRDVALARGKVSRAPWPLNPEKGDAPGRSTGPRTQAGRARTAAAQRRRMATFPPQ
jgi:hypothetical protein